MKLFIIVCVVSSFVFTKCRILEGAKTLPPKTILKCFECDPQHYNCAHPTRDNTVVKICGDLNYECVSVNVTNGHVNGLNGIYRDCVPGTAVKSACQFATDIFPNALVRCKSCKQNLCNNVLP